MVLVFFPDRDIFWMRAPLFLARGFVWAVSASFQAKNQSHLRYAVQRGCAGKTWVWFALHICFMALSAMFTTAVVVCFAYLTAESDFSPCFSVFLLSSGSSWWVREALVQGEGLRITLLFFQAQMFPECACLSRNDGYIPRYALEWIHEHQPLIDLVPRPVSNHRFRGPGRTQTTCLPPTPASTCSCCRSTRTRRSSPGSLRRPSRSAKVSGSSSRHFG